MLTTELQRAIACAGSDDDLVVFVPGEPSPDPARIRQTIQQRYRLFPGHVRVVPLPALPLSTTGKTDYAALNEHAAGDGASG